MKKSHGKMIKNYFNYLDQLTDKIKEAIQML